jgi:hypothetical protein
MASSPDYARGFLLHAFMFFARPMMPRFVGDARFF